jgi:Flp pilus assembly protein TadD
MERKIINILNKIISWGLIFLVGFIPLFFLPFTSEFYEFNKNILLLVVSGLLLVVWVLKMVLEKKVSFRQTPFDLPVLTIAGVFILSTIFASTNKWETLWIPGGTGTILGLTVLYFVMTNVIRDTQYVKRIIWGLTISAIILSLTAIYQFIGLGETLIPQNSFWAFLRLKSWTPAGGLLPLATFLIVIIALLGTQIYNDWKARHRLLLFSSFTLLLLISGLVVSLYQLFIPTKPVLLPYSTSWAIAIESFKNWRSFLFGVGPTSFVDAFSQFRPISYNLGNLWAIRFVVSGNYYLHLLTTVGILGLGAFLWLVGKIIKAHPVFIIHYSLFIILVLFLFLPSSFLLIFVFYILVALLAINLPTREHSESSKIVPWIIFIPALLFVLCAMYFVGRAYTAEVYFKKSLNASMKNDGTSTYNNQVKAIALNPYNDVYRIAYSQTNLALANSLATNPPAGGLSDQDRQNITSLVQQAIREAKFAVSLNKNKIINWENLGQIYRQLVNFAQGADQWTIASFRQAANLDPANPNLKLNIGGIYYSLGDYDEAIRWFQQSIDIKPNFANGYYNLAAAYREKGDFKKAHEAMQTTVSLVPSTSEDYQKAQRELEELARKVSEKEATFGAKIKTQPEVQETPLTEPQPLPSPIITPPIELPQQSAPEINPAPEATP